MQIVVVQVIVVGLELLNNLVVKWSTRDPTALVVKIKCRAVSAKGRFKEGRNVVCYAALLLGKKEEVEA